jgi:hypothetical protein
LLILFGCGFAALGNKAVYRTRMALADGGELVILAPGVRQFGEDAEIDRLIRRFGYRGTRATVAAVETHPELTANLSAAAHLIHGSSEGPVPHHLQPWTHNPRRGRGGRI